MKKSIVIPILIVTHLMCLALGYEIGASQRACIEESASTSAPTENGTEGIVEQTVALETTEVTVPTEEFTIPTEVAEETTEATESQEAPAYTPVATTPPATQPAATNPPTTEPPATQSPPPQPPATEAPGSGSGTVLPDDEF